MPFPSFPEEQLYTCGKLQPLRASLLGAIVIFSLQRLGSNRGLFSLQTQTFRRLIDKKRRDDLTQCSVTRVIFQVMILLGKRGHRETIFCFCIDACRPSIKLKCIFLPSYHSSWLLSSVLWRDAGWRTALKDLEKLTSKIHWGLCDVIWAPRSVPFELVLLKSCRNSRSSQSRCAPTVLIIWLVSLVVLLFIFEWQFC